MRELHSFHKRADVLQRASPENAAFWVYSHIALFCILRSREGAAPRVSIGLEKYASNSPLFKACIAASHR